MLKKVMRSGMRVACFYMHARRVGTENLDAEEHQTAHNSAAVTLHWTACRHKRPRCRPGRRNVPRAPNPLDEAIPSHPLPMTGRTSMPTTTHHTSARANDRDHRSNMSSPSLLPMTLPSPSHQPFTICWGLYSYGMLMDRPYLG